MGTADLGNMILVLITQRMKNIAGYIESRTETEKKEQKLI